MAYKRKFSRRKFSRNRRGKYSRRARPTFQSRVKKVLMRNTETKYLQVGQEDRQLYHDVGVGTGPTTNQVAILFDPWQYVAVGTGRQNRIGDQITPRGIALRLWLANKADRMDILYRVIICVLPRAIGNTYTLYNNVDLFQAMDQGTNNSTITAMVDMEKCKKVLVDRTYHLQNATGFDTKEVHMLKKFWIKAKNARAIKYTSAGAHANNLLGVYVIPYDSYGTLQIDNIASAAYTARLYFKDA